MSAQAAGEPDGQAAPESARAVGLQLEERAYLLKEEFQLFWEYNSPTWAAKFLDAWCKRAMRSRIEPVKKFARTACAPRTAAQLFQGQQAVFQRHHRGPEQQGQSHSEKSVWLQDVPHR